jgi:hypothetical protein
MSKRFWLSYTGERGTLKQATPSPGDAVHIRGWNAGVKVNPRPRARDEFDVYLTTGSHETGHDVLLGTVKDTPDGPVWEPAAGTASDLDTLSEISDALQDACADPASTLRRIEAALSRTAGALQDGTAYNLDSQLYS